MNGNREQVKSTLGSLKRATLASKLRPSYTAAANQILGMFSCINYRDKGRTKSGSSAQKDGIVCSSQCTPTTPTLRKDR